MNETDPRAGLFPALLRYWRRQRGLSQLDLALAADVSARHVSFLETGRSSPSPEMVVLLGNTLGVPLRQVNAMLRAAGHEAIYGETHDAIPASVQEAIGVMARHQEPYPLVVIDQTYRVVQANHGAAAILGFVMGAEPGSLDAGSVATMDLNLARLTFELAAMGGSIVNFDEVGRQLLWRIQREVLADPDDRELNRLLDDLLAMPTVDPDWRQVDLAVASDPALVLHLRRDDVDLRFLTTVTAFQAPQNVAVEHLRIESWFPYDDPTAEFCRRLTA